MGLSQTMNLVILNARLNDVVGQEVKDLSIVVKQILLRRGGSE